MTRPLLITVACGYIVALVCFAIAFAIAGPSLAPWSWHGDWSDVPWSWHDRRGPAIEASGPTITRELAWPGGDELQVSVPASVTYTQGPQAKVTVTGPKSAVDHLYIDDGRFRFDRRVRGVRGLDIKVIAPDVREFRLAGSQRLSILAYDHDALEVHMAGSGDVTGEGRARRVEVQIAGSGDIDLGKVAADDAEVHIAGSGATVLSPRSSADIHIAGSGDVTLTTRPPKVETHIAGSGRIVQGAGQAAPSEPAPSIAPKTKT